MKIGIVGAGKVGTSLGKYLTQASIPVVGYYSKTYESAKESAAFTNTKAFSYMEDLIQASDTLFITTPDDCIKTVWDCIAKHSIQKKIICHFSGSLSSVVFSGIEETEAYGCSIHPMLAFSNKFSSYKQLNQAFITMEGDSQGLDVMEPFFQKLGNQVCRISPENKQKYHTAASMVSNHVIGLLDTGVQLLCQCGFREQEALKFITPLVLGNIENFLKYGAKEALTGPIERNDIKTVSKHLDCLSEKDRLLYQLLGEKLVAIAKTKHENQDYKEMTNLLEVSNEKYSCNI